MEGEEDMELSNIINEGNNPNDEQNAQIVINPN
jgi:hypothetical protein